MVGGDERKRRDGTTGKGWDDFGVPSRNKSMTFKYPPWQKGGRSLQLCSEDGCGGGGEAMYEWRERHEKHKGR